MEYESQWCTVRDGLLRFDGEAFRIADVSSTSISRRPVPERIYSAGFENLALWILSAVGGWAGILLTTWETGVKVLLGFAAFFGTGGLSTIPIDKFKIKRWNESRPSYHVLTIHFRGSRPPREIDLYPKMAKYHEETATAAAVDSEVPKIASTIEVVMRSAA